MRTRFFDRVLYIPDCVVLLCDLHSLINCEVQDFRKSQRYIEILSSPLGKGKSWPKTPHTSYKYICGSLCNPAWKLNLMNMNCTAAILYALCTQMLISSNSNSNSYINIGIQSVSYGSCLSPLLSGKDHISRDHQHDAKIIYDQKFGFSFPLLFL